MSIHKHACRHNWIFQSDRERSDPKHCYQCRIAELEAERDSLREAAKRFLTTKGSPCVSALFDLLQVLGMDLSECAARDTEQEIQALTAERDRYKAEVEELRANLEGIKQLMSDE